MIHVADHRRRAVLALDSLVIDTGFRWIVPSCMPPLGRPAGLVLLPIGWIAVTDRELPRVLLVDPATGSSIALDPSASPIGALKHPGGLALLPDGRLVIADTGNHRIVVAGVMSGPPWLVWGESIALAPDGLDAPTSLAVDGAGRLFIADPGTSRVIRLDAVDGSGRIDFELPAGSRPSRPYALAAGPAGGVLVSDLPNSRVLLLGADDSFTVLIDGTADDSLIDGTANAALIAPVALAMHGADILVADAAAARIGRWAFDDATQAWVGVETLRGDPGIGTGPAFSSLTALAVTPGGM